MSYRILIVDPDSQSAGATELLLSDAGYRVTSVGTFDEASRQLSLDSPDLLVTAVRLGAFNGVHLVLRCRGDFPDMPVIVTSEEEDPLLAAEVTRYGARFVTRPVDREPLLRLVSELIAGRSPHDLLGARRWPRKRARLPATVAQTAARVVDLSYGGLRLEIEGSASAFETPMDIDFPTLGLSIKAVPRWTKPIEAQSAYWCGAEVAPIDSEVHRTWRWVVDSLI